MGTNTWRNASSMEAISKDSLTLYFSNILGKHGYKLLPKAPVLPGEIDQEVNFLDRSEPAGRDQQILDSAIGSTGKMVFVSEPLEKATVMTGSFQGMIAATLNKKDIDIAIDLYELRPDGKYFFLSFYIGRASYAKNRSNRQLLQPGREEHIPISNSFFISKQLSKGSRIVIVMGMNNNDSWQINYGTGKDVSEETIADGKVPLGIKWSNKSYIKLPIEKE